MPLPFPMGAGRFFSQVFLRAADAFVSLRIGPESCLRHAFGPLVTPPPAWM